MLTLERARRKEENAVWDQVQAKDACLRRLDEQGFPKEMRALAEASNRFYELGVYYRNPLEVRYASQEERSRFETDTAEVQQ